LGLWRDLSSTYSSLELLMYHSNKLAKRYISHAKTHSQPYRIFMRHCISLPATSASVERVVTHWQVVSNTDYIASARRSRLSKTSVELLVIAKCRDEYYLTVLLWWF